MTCAIVARPKDGTWEVVGWTVTAAAAEACVAEARHALGLDARVATIPAEKC